MTATLEKAPTTVSIDKTMSKGIGETYDLANADVVGEDDFNTKLAEKKLLRKIDLCLLPLLTLSYALQFLDKQTLNFASIMGLISDLGLHGTQYSWSGSIFYFGYLAFSYPASYLMVRLPLAKYLAGTCVVWAVCLCCHAACTTWTGLMVVRFFLGCAEASISPGFGLITGMGPSESLPNPLTHH
jgi:MFS transporter, ACS family, allantoate permease